MNISDMASIASIVLSVVAIGLSCLFYHWTSCLNANTREALARIDAITQDMHSNQWDLVKSVVFQLAQQGQIQLAPLPELEEKLVRAYEESLARQARMREIRRRLEQGQQPQQGCFTAHTQAHGG